MGLHKTKGNLDVAKKENSVIEIEEDYSTKYEGFDPNSTESYIIFSLMQNVYLDQSLEFASYVQDQFENRAKRHNRGVKQAGFLVLWKTTMPSVLIEAGFISNEAEEKYLLSEAGQDYIASAIYRAVGTFFEDREENIISDLLAIDTLKRVKNDTLANVIIEEKQINNEYGIMFCIQIASSSKSLIEPNEYFKDFEVKEYKINNTYKYTVNENNDYIIVKNGLAEVRKKYPDAFIIAFEKGKKISVKKALEKLNKK
jgi:N-acetylmuramoyl-L-alanine amidase